VDPAVRRDADPAEELLTNEQVIDVLMGVEKLRRAALTCVLPAVLIGSRWYFRRSDLDAWVAKQHRTAD
jgi:hypothetical protein